MLVPIRIVNVMGLPKDVWHPSVIYIPEGWNGHRWWMSESPYSPRYIAPYTDRWELPCIHYSDDGLTWKPIADNPIDNLTSLDIDSHNYLSDPHLVMRNGVLYCYYRHTLLVNRQLKGNKTLLYRKSSANGKHWSEREVIADLRKGEDAAIWGEQIISQSVLWNDAKQIWECWYVDGSGDKLDRGIRYVTSANGVLWEKYQQCAIFVEKDLPWHIDVQIYDGIYYMLCYTDKNQLLLYTSQNGIDFMYRNVVLTPQPNTFYRERIYRSCSVYDGEKYRIYFSGFDDHYGRIGVVETKDWKAYRVKSVWWNMDYYTEQLMRKWKSFKRSIKQKVKQILSKTER